MELFSNEAVLNGFKAIMTGCLRRLVVEYFLRGLIESSCSASSPCPVILSCVADNCNIVSSSGLKMTDVLDGKKDFCFKGTR